MPIYEYECKECGVQFNRLQRFGDPPPESCPNGHGAVHRLLSQPTIIFKGSGFYVTDTGRNGNGTSPRETGQKAKSQKSTAKS